MKRVEEVPVTAEVTDAYRPPYLAAVIASLLVWALYALTLAPTTAFWDTSEYIATAHILGIPHPPGNPLFVVLARAWDILLSPLGLSVAVRINLFSATMGALAHGCWFLLAHRVMAYYSTSRVFRTVGAALAVLVSATAFTVWNQSNVNEKVYTVSLFTIALLSWLAFRWRDHLGEGKDDNLILLMVFILALSVGNHLMAFLAAPALIAFILWVAPRTLTNWRLYAFGVVAVILGLSIHFFLPLRAGLSPVINEADPTCPSFGSAVQSVMTMGRSGCPNLSESLSRTQYDKPSMFSDPVAASRGQDLPRPANLFVAQVANYLQYFDWQWGRSVSGNASFFGGLRPLVTLLIVLLGLYGAITHYQRDRKSWAYLAILFITLSLGLVFYLNFKYGYSYPGDQLTLEDREVRERDYFFIVSFSIWGIWAGIGIAALWQWLGETYLRMTRPAEQTPPLAAAPVLALALIPFVLNFGWANRRYDYSARDWAYNLLNSVEPYGVLFTNGDNDTFPLWYAQEVEGIRQDVTVIVMSYLNTPWYVKQLKKLTEPCAPGQNPAADPTIIICQRPFDTRKGPPIYTAYAERKPTKSIMPLSIEQIEELANTYPFQTQQAQVFRVRGIETVVPAGVVMLPADLFMGHIISQSLGDRPIYFATTTQAFEELNLGSFLIRHGVAYKLNDGPVQADPAKGLVAMPSNEMAAIAGPYVDLQRTETLLSDIFVHREGFPEEWNQWVDAATQNIPYYYFATHLITAQAYQLRGDTARAEQHARIAEKWGELSQK
ncbi:MAG TPA: DUF2723 domain-containing protein [Longimicrobiales bacterium]|nr:DUF2723 domain-containing protein [Longimicrobiales bacterium]